jgi:hypothetical protein
VELLTTTDCFVDIGGIDDHHCLEVIVLLILVELLTITA